jgi:hypothetical protein
VHTGHVNTLLPDFALGKLNEEDIVGVEAHLEGCAQCRMDLAELKETFASIGLGRNAAVPASYFSSILPRVHERLEQRQRSRWMISPVVEKIALPLGAAIVIAILAWNVPGLKTSIRTEGSLATVMDSASPSEIAEIIRNDIPSQDWSSFTDALIAHALANDKYVQQELVEEALTSEVTSPFNVYADVSPQQFLNGLDEPEANTVLQQLGQRKSL